VNDNLLFINVSTPPPCLFLSCLTTEYPGMFQFTIKNAGWCNYQKLSMNPPSHTGFFYIKSCMQPRT